MQLSAGVRGVWLRARALVAVMLCITLAAEPVFGAGRALPPPPGAGEVEHPAYLRDGAPPEPLFSDDQLEAHLHVAAPQW